MATIYNMKGTTFPSFSIGKKGTTILQGTGAPQAAVGADGDLYIQHGGAGSQKLFQKLSGAWMAFQLNSVRLDQLNTLVPAANSFVGTDAQGLIMRNAVQSRAALGLGTVAVLDSGTGNGQVPVLGSDGKLTAAVMPAFSITDVNVVTTNAQRDALVAQSGDIAINTAEGMTYIYDGVTWRAIGYASSVQGIQGASSVKAGVVSLDTTDILSGIFATQRGGTGYASFAKGDLLVGTAAGSLNKLTAGVDGKLLTLSGGTPVWGDVAASQIAYDASSAPHSVAGTVQTALAELAGNRSFVHSENRNPTTADFSGYRKGDLWVNTISMQTFIATAVSDSAAGWREIAKPALMDKLVVVSGNGADSNDGSFNSPVSSITQAMTMVGVGGAILVMPGQYVENITVNKPNVCLYGENVTLQGAFSLSVSSSGFVSRGIRYTNPTGTPVSVSGLNLNNVLFRNSTIEATSPGDYSIVLLGNLGANVRFTDCTITGVVKNASTSSNRISIRACAGGFGVENTSGALSISNVDEMAALSHTAGAVTIANVGRIVKNGSGQSITSVASSGLIDLSNVSLRQADGSFGSLNFGACNFALNDVDRDPAQNFNEDKRLYGRNARDIAGNHTGVSYRETDGSITGHLTGLDNALGTVLGAAVKTFNDLHDTLDYTPGDANRVVKINSDGTGTSFGYVLGTASQNNTGDFGTAAQGIKADTAVQPGDLSEVARAGQGSFLHLTDAAGLTYLGASRQLVRVREDESGLEFAGPLGATAYSNDYGDLTGLPTLGTAAAKDFGDNAGQLPLLDANGKLNPSTMPALAITDVYVVEDFAQRDALEVQGGDVAKITSTGQTFIFDGTLWVEMVSPDAVQSVNGKSGTIVLVGADISVQRVGTNYTASGDSIADHFAGVDTALSLLASKADLTSFHEEVSNTYETIENVDALRAEIYSDFQTQADAQDDYDHAVATYETKDDAAAAYELLQTKADAQTNSEFNALTYQTQADAAARIVVEAATFETKDDADAREATAVATYYTKQDASTERSRVDSTFQTKEDALAAGSAASGSYQLKTDAEADRQAAADTYYTKSAAQTERTRADGTYETKDDASAFAAQVGTTYATKAEASAAAALAASTYETQAHASSTYATKADSDSTYETKAHASDTFATKTDVAATYETKTHAADTYYTKTAATAADTANASTYETQAHASATYDTKSNTAATYVGKSSFTAAGDILVGTGAATYGKLGKGSNGQVLTVDNTGAVVWSTPTAGVTSLSALTDVLLSSPSNGQVLTYNGTKWVNATVNTSSATGDRISTGTTSVQTAEVANTVTVNANGKRVVNFVGGTATGGERLTVSSDLSKLTLGTGNTAGTGSVDLEFTTQGAGQVRFNLSGTASMRSGAGEALTIQPGDSSTGNGVALTLIGGSTTGSGGNGGDIILQPGALGAGGSSGQVKLSSGYTPASVDSVVQKSYVDNRRLDQAAAPTGAVNAANQFINNVRDPVLDADAANRKFVVSRSSQFEVSLVATSATYDVALTEHVILVKRNTAAPTTVRLPASGSVSVGKSYTIKDAAGTSATTNTVTVQGISGETIDGAPNQVINQPYESITVIWNGSEWNII